MILYIAFIVKIKSITTHTNIKKIVSINICAQQWRLVTLHTGLSAPPLQLIEIEMYNLRAKIWSLLAQVTSIFCAALMHW